MALKKLAAQVESSHVRRQAGKQSLWDSLGV